MDPSFTPLPPSTLLTLDPKTRINYELEYLRHNIAQKRGNAEGLNEWTAEQLVSMDQELRERIAFIGQHPLFGGIRSEGRPDDCVQRFWGMLVRMSEEWVGEVREVDAGYCRTVQGAMGRARVD
ncbi:MAG: hypothetical protein Q9195_006425 [Heterodermia aff. obscurata]